MFVEILIADELELIHELLEKVAGSLFGLVATTVTHKISTINNLIISIN